MYIDTNFAHLKVEYLRPLYSFSERLKKKTLMEYDIAYYFFIFFWNVRLKTKNLKNKQKRLI